MMRSELCGRLLVLALVASIGLGCYGPKFEDCTLKCSNEIGCPGGLTCKGGFCSAGPQCRMDGGPDTGDAGDAHADLGDAPVNDTDGAGDLGEAGDRDTDEPDGMDAGPDVATDTDVDAGPDVATDTDVDAGPDVATDTDVDAGPDVPVDAPADSPDHAPPEVGGPGIDGPDGGDRPPTWRPAVISNLVLWLESDRGIDAPPGSEKISAWRDQSGLHNDAQADDGDVQPLRWRRQSVERHAGGGVHSSRRG